MQRLAGVSVIILIVASSVWGQVYFDFSWKVERGNKKYGFGVVDPDNSHFTKLGNYNLVYRGDLSPDGTRMAYAFNASEMGFDDWGVTWRSLDGSERPEWPIFNSGSDGPLRSVEWSPVGDDLLAFLFLGGGAQEIIVITLEGGVVKRIPNDVLDSRQIFGITWAPGGRIIYWTRSSEVWITDGDTSHFISKGTYSDVAPNGKRMAVIVRGEEFNRDDYSDFPDDKIAGYEKSVWTMDLDGSNKKLIHKWELGSNSIAWSPDSRELVFADGIRVYENVIKTVTLDLHASTICRSGK